MQVVENFCSFILPIFFLSVHGTFFFCLGIFYEKKKQSGEYKKMTLKENSMNGSREKTHERIL